MGFFAMYSTFMSDNKNARLRQKEGCIKSMDVAGTGKKRPHPFYWYGGSKCRGVQTTQPTKNSLRILMRSDVVSSSPSAPDAPRFRNARGACVAEETSMCSLVRGERVGVRGWAEAA